MDAFAGFNDVEHAERVDVENLDAAFGLIVQHGSEVARYVCNVDRLIRDAGGNFVCGAVHRDVVDVCSLAVFGVLHQLDHAHGGRALEGSDFIGGGGECLRRFGGFGGRFSRRLGGGLCRGFSAAFGRCALGGGGTALAAGCKYRHAQQHGEQNSGYFLHLKRSFLLRRSAAEIVREFVSANSIIVAQKGAHCQRIVNFLRDFSFEGGREFVRRFHTRKQNLKAFRRRE